MCIYIYVYIYILTSLYIYIYLCVCIYIYMHMHMHITTCVYMLICKYIYIYTYTIIYIHHLSSDLPHVFPSCLPRSPVLRRIGDPSALHRLDLIQFLSVHTGVLAEDGRGDHGKTMRKPWLLMVSIHDEQYFGRS